MAANTPDSSTVGLLQTGHIDCRVCFPSSYSKPTLITGSWQLTNNPFAIGCQKPRILVLGFSKGKTQCSIWERGGEADQVLFGGISMRRNLTYILRTLGLLAKNEKVDDRISRNEKIFAFASLVRCSISRSLRGQYVTSGTIIQKAFREIPGVLENCANRFLRHLPTELKLILMLGLGDSYIANCRVLLERMTGVEAQILNPVTYLIGERLWVHVAHPSPANVSLRAWLDGNGEGVQVQKCRFAKRAVN